MPTLHRAAPAPTPNEEEILALLDCCRYGDVDEGDFDDIKRFAEHYGDRWLAEAKDDRGNTPLHMAAGNGHVGAFASRVARRVRASSG